MSKNIDSKNSVSSSVFGIKRLLRDLQTKLPALSKASKEPTANNELHAFGTVNIDKARTEFKQHIDIIRSICSQFETEVLGDVMKQGSGAESSFGKHFNQLKEQATTESTVIRLQEYLQQSSALLETALNDKEASKPTVKVQQLEKLAKSMGLVSFVDSSQKESGVPSTTITLGGKVIVIDIDIDNDGLVQRAKVTFVSEALQKDHDENLDLLLAEDLQTHNFDAFKRDLGTLALLDELNVEYTPTDFFTMVRNLYKDMRINCSQETLLLSNNIFDVLLDGHGIPSLYLDFPGISIAYWMDKTKAKTINWDDVRDTVEQKKIHTSLRQAAKLLICFEDSSTPQYFLPPHRSNYMLSFDETEDSIGDEFKIISEAKCPRFMQPLRFVRPVASSGGGSIPLRFVAKLDVPLPVSDIIMQKLAEATGLVKENEFPPSSTGRSIPDTLSLEELIVVDCLPADTNALNPVWLKKIDDSSDQVYQWTSNIGTPGKLIHRIPFQHPAQLYNIMMYLRQQQTFNALFASIFNKETYKSGNENVAKATRTLSLDEILMASDSDDKLLVEVMTFNAPRMIQLSLSPPASKQYSFVSIPILIDIPTSMACHPRVQLEPPIMDLEASKGKEMVWNPRLFNQDKMNKVLQNEFKIFDLVAWLWKTIDQNEGNYWLERPLKRSHTSMMDLDDGFMGSQNR